MRSVELFIDGVLAPYITYSLISRHYNPVSSLCTSLIAWCIDAPASAVLPLVRGFTNPPRCNLFIESRHMRDGDGGVGSVRDIAEILGLPVLMSVRRLEVLDDNERMKKKGRSGLCIWESYVLQIHEGNTGEDTKSFAHSILKRNLRKLDERVTASWNKERMEENRHDGDEKRR
ncbi:abscisic acid receptor PYL2-like [Eucalyptus grandis]|uniref:abscisic acid receptor PYL2-like n=1 Tax=Eucalyptus grandis TaxID=71139 RepID=UPI00192F11D3|nr:abscisic acid receptor PYL2-like [Eucalyptus grandis]